MSLLQSADESVPVRPLEGRHRAIVVDNNDPKHTGRVKIYIKGVIDPGKPPEFEDGKLKTPPGYDGSKRGVGTDEKIFFTPKKVKNYKNEVVEALPWAYPRMWGGDSAATSSAAYPSIGMEIEVWFPFDDVYLPMYVGFWSDVRSATDKIKGDAEWIATQLKWKKEQSLVKGFWDRFNQNGGKNPPKLKWEGEPVDWDLVDEMASYLFGDDYPYSSGYFDETGTFLKVNKAKGSIIFSHRPSNTKITLDKWGNAELSLYRLDLSPRHPQQDGKNLIDQGQNEFNAGQFVSPNIFVNAQPVNLGSGCPPFGLLFDRQTEKVYMNPESYLWAGLDLEPMIPMIGFSQQFELQPDQLVYLKMTHDETDQGNVILCELIIGPPWDLFPKIVEKGDFHQDCPTYCPDDGAFTAKKSYKLLAFGEAPSLQSLKPGFLTPDKVRVVFCVQTHLILQHVYHDEAAFKYPMAGSRPWK